MTSDAAPDPPVQMYPQPTLGSAAGPDDCEVLLIRHGRSADVALGAHDAHDAPLHEIGVEQAQKLAVRLAPKMIHAVYSSHLRRAHQTAQAVAGTRGMTVETFEDLEEIRAGEWGQGEFRRRAATQDPEWLAWSKTGRWDGIPGGEGDDALRARFAAVIELLADRHRGQTIAVVAHGGAIGAYLSHVLGIHRSIWLTVENTSITKVVLGPDGVTVVAAGDCHHLYDPVFGPVA